MYDCKTIFFYVKENCELLKIEKDSFQVRADFRRIEEERVYRVVELSTRSGFA